VKLTKESAQLVKKYGLTQSKTPGVRHAMVGKPGAIKKWLQIEKAPGILLTNPALLASAAGITAQVAMQQAMDEITDHLAAIDEKVNDVLRAQKDTVLADMIGVDLVIDEAMTIREKVGRVSEVTWSKVQATSATITRTQPYASFLLVASNCRTPSPYWNSTGCWTPLRTSWTGIASDFELPGRSGRNSTRGAPIVTRSTSMTPGKAWRPQ
jgi:hypothetical protein